MYKALLIFSMALSLSQGSLACDEEAALLIASVAKTEQTATSCRVFINPAGIKLYQPSLSCALPLTSIITEGVEVVGFLGEQCKTLKELSGTAVAREGRIILE